MDIMYKKIVIYKLDSYVCLCVKWWNAGFLFETRFLAMVTAINKLIVYVCANLVTQQYHSVLNKLY